MSFLDALEKGLNQGARTENDAVTNFSSLDPVLDFFSLAGAMRHNVGDATKLFRNAYAADRQAAARTLFYLRDARGGQGERNLFRALYRELGNLDGRTATDLLVHIPTYGRWDDLVDIANTTQLARIVAPQLTKDLAAMRRGESVSLMAKWLPSENASSKDSKVKARELAAALGMTNREYRQHIVALRKHISLLEQKMSARAWDEIDYSKLPSQAGRKHTRAFQRHDSERYSSFLDRATKGEVKLNAGTVYTYEVYDMVKAGKSAEADAFWANLPDYTNGSNALVMADTSGSMFGGYHSQGATPISVSVSLALYFAEHNKGAFKDYFLTFSERPQLQKVRGKTLTERMTNLSQAAWGMNTNVEAAFRAVLDAAIQSNASADEIPKVLYIISDMEFDACTTDKRASNFDNARRMFNEAGYELPHLVFWNVNARNTNTPATKYDRNVTLISGLSQSTFRYVVEGKTPLESMLDVINSERYAPIVVEDKPVSRARSGYWRGEDFPTSVEKQSWRYTKP